MLKITLTTSWKEVKKVIKDDPRCIKFSSSDRVRMFLFFFLFVLIFLKKSFYLFLCFTWFSVFVEETARI